ncbi:MAG: universal stress protein [Nitrospiraceae bacterium]|nr:universal stress protein [Nitrospiraceae bacterium]
MYKRILIPIDNSRYSPWCTDLAIALARRTGAGLTGSHVYSAALHDRRFHDMEAGLPGPYRQEDRLRQSRKVHDSLIGDGLKLISDAYLDPFKKGCTEAGVQFDCRLQEGKNWLEIVRDERAGGYGLVIMGVLGLGAVNGSLIGGVCERVARKVTADVLVVKNGSPLGAGRIVVAIDGSTAAFSAFRKAAALAAMFGMDIEAVSVYDPHFHRRAFESLVRVLSDEARKVFRFQEQERLHDEIIDDGLGKIYQDALDEARAEGLKSGVGVKTTLLAGKAGHELCMYLKKDPPALFVAGRFGAHRTEELDIGNTAENLLRTAPCNVLVCGEKTAAPTGDPGSRGPGQRG